MRHKLLFILIACSLLCSCAHTQEGQEKAYDVLKRLSLERIPAAVSFDPYSSTIYFDRNVIENIGIKNQVRVASSTEWSDCIVTPQYWNVSEDVFIRDYLEKRVNVQNDLWKRQIYQQFMKYKQGWAIVQAEYPKAGLQHGDFTVKCLVIYFMDWCGVPTYGYWPRFYFEIQSKALTSQGPGQKQTSSEDSATKLKKLKEMLDSGLITQDDYDAKKKSIIDGI